MADLTLSVKMVLQLIPTSMRCGLGAAYTKYSILATEFVTEPLYCLPDCSTWVFYDLTQGLPTVLRDGYLIRFEKSVEIFDIGSNDFNGDENYAVFGSHDFEITISKECFKKYQTTRAAQLFNVTQPPAKETNVTINPSPDPSAGDIVQQQHNKQKLG